MDATEDRPFPVPLWILSLTLLSVELSLYVLLGVALFPASGKWWAIVATTCVMPFVLRLIVALMSYRLSRWKGMVIPAELSLGTWTWLRFFAIEYAHLCLQSLMLIPFRPLFRTASEAGKGRSTGPVVLLQHGYAHNGGVWFFTARALERAGFRVFTMDQPVFASIDTMGDLLGERIAEVLRTTGAADLTLVAHSMGGLVCRAYLRRHGGHHVRRLVTLGTPHRGTFHAMFANGKNGAQMRLGNQWLEQLGTTRVEVPFASIYSVHDTIIAPQNSSEVEGAENIRLSGIGHVSMPSGRRTRAELSKVLARP